MEPSTLIGILVGFGAIILSIIVDGGSFTSLINEAAAIMVIGGSTGALLVSYPLSAITTLPQFIMMTFQKPKVDFNQLVELFVGLADRARREGLLSLEEEVSQIDDDFMKKGIMLIVDGVDPSVVQEVLETDTDLMEERQRDGVAMLSSLGAFGPTMGMIGTVIGLIGVLSQLSDPENLGGSIAVAFTSTLYGVLLANLFWLPMATKLKTVVQTNVNGRNMITQGILSVQAGENPRIVQEKLEGYLDPKTRGQEKSDDDAGGEEE